MSARVAYGNLNISFCTGFPRTSATMRIVRRETRSNCLVIRRYASALRDHGQLDKACLAGRVIDPLDRFSIVPLLRPENVWHERLRIAVIQRKPTRLHLHHDAVTGQEDVIRCRQREPVKQRLVGCDWFRGLETLTIT